MPSQSTTPAWQLERRPRSCFIETAAPHGTYAKIEHDPFHWVHYMSISAPAWDDVRDTQAYQVGLRYRNQARREFKATAVKDVDRPRALVIFRLPRDGPFGQVSRYITGMRYARALQLDLDGARPLNLDARGLRSGLVALHSCTRTLLSLRSSLR